MHSTQVRNAEPAVERFYVTQADVGRLGIVDGATVFEWIDTAAYATAARWCGGHCVAASMGNFHLDRPICVGELVKVHADLVYTGSSSMHILVTVAWSGQNAQCSIVFVAVDDDGHVVDVPQWTPVTMLDLQRQRQARVRIRMRKRIEDPMPAQPHQASRVSRLAEGAVSAGRVMRWIDEAACARGADWTGAEVVSSYVAGMRFCGRPVPGDSFEVSARVIHTGPRSVHTSVCVTAADPVACAVVVVVSLDAHGAARPVPQWRPASEPDCRVDMQARQLIELRQFIEPFTCA